MTSERDDGRLQLFVQAHVQNQAELAVYTALGGSPEAALSAPEIAALARADAYEVDVVLRRFANAGIVKVAAGGDGWHAYRWRDEMRYLFEDAATTGSGDDFDPVCGMPVGPDAPHVIDDSAGPPVRFCSQRCLTIFRSASGASGESSWSDLPSLGRSRGGRVEPRSGPDVDPTRHERAE